MWTQSLRVSSFDLEKSKKNSESILCDTLVSFVEEGICIHSRYAISSQLKALLLGYLYVHERIFSIEDVSSFSQTLNELSFSLGKLSQPILKTPKIFPPLKRSQLFALMSLVRDRAFLYEQTSITVTGAVLTEKDIFAFAEDVSSENVLYKLMGLFLQEKQPSVFALFVSAPLQVFEIDIAIRLGVKFVFTRLAPTAQALALAEEKGICIIGFIRRSRFTVYSGLAYCSF